MKNEEKRDKIIFIDYADDIYVEDLTSNLKLDIDREQQDAVSNTPSMAKIINAICRSVSCDICPYPCGAKVNSSVANCITHWFDILSNMEIKNRNEVCDEAFKLLYKDSFRFN